MKQAIFKHSLWASVTISAFFIGQRMSDSLSNPNAGEPQQRHRSLSTSSNGTTSATATDARLFDPSSSSARAGGDKAHGSLGSDPLSQEMIESLVRASIKSGSPLDRRLAFDNILREMQSPGFTTEQAMAIRNAMLKGGANEEDLKLFDYAWAAKNPDAALAYLKEIPEQQRYAFLNNMLPGLASQNPRMAIDLFKSLEPELQTRTRPRFLEGLVDNDAEVATDYLYKSTDAENYNWRPMDELARELVRDRGLDATLEWAGELPDGPLRGSAWSAAYAVWASQDAQAASQSILAMPEGTDRNLAINGLVSAHAHEDGASSAIWAAEIDEPNLRESAMIRVGRQYYAQNPEAATQWFASTGLPQTAWTQMTTPTHGQ